MAETETTPLAVRDTPIEGVARITLNRPLQRNAQNVALLYELDRLFEAAARDAAVRVVILAGAGVDFSTGHDLKSTQEIMATAAAETPIGGSWGGYAEAGAHGFYAIEKDVYLNLTKRWRELSKPTIAAVQGHCIAAGLMLAWACDIIVAADNARFSDPVLTFGMPGVEWFAHPYELGPRKAKELLFTSDVWDAAEAHRLGMVNHVVAPDQLESFVLAMARKIAGKPAFALKLAKEAVNRCEDLGGKTQGIEAFFAVHHLAHQHNQLLFGALMDPSNLPRMTSIRRRQD